MKTLVIIGALVACCAANPGWVSSVNPVVGHSLIGGNGLLGASNWLGARSLVSGAISPYAYASGVISPYAFSSGALLSGPSVIQANTIAAPSLLSQPLIRTIAAPSLVSAPVVASAPAVVATRTIAAPIVASAPAVVATKTIATPIVAAAPAVTKTQWHSQTELGQASYGHTEPLQTHTAVQDAHGNKVGSFSYLNPHDGQIHRTDYVADAAGYRVAANDLPADTPDVAIAKAAHAAAHLRARRGLGYIASPYSIYNTQVAAPVAIAAPALHLPNLHEATLTTIVNNPGHAVSYRVD